METLNPKKTKFPDEDDLIQAISHIVSQDPVTRCDLERAHEDQEINNDAKKVTVSSGQIKDSSDDEAPEEISTGESKDATLKKSREAKAARDKALQEQRYKRRKLAEHNAIQQQVKRKKAKTKSHYVEDLPEYLPDDLANAFATKAKDKEFQKKHHKIRELDAIQQREVRKNFLEEKLKKIKGLKSMAVKKGPIMVQQQNYGHTRHIVPSADLKVVGLREQWLQRKALNKK